MFGAARVRGGIVTVTETSITATEFHDAFDALVQVFDSSLFIGCQ